MKRWIVLLALAGAPACAVPVSFVIKVARPSSPTSICPSEMPATPRALPLNSANVMLSTGEGFAVQKGEHYRMKNGYKNVFDRLKLTEQIFPNWVSCNYGANNNYSRTVRLPEGTDTCVVAYTTRPKKVTIKCS